MNITPSSTSIAGARVHLVGEIPQLHDRVELCNGTLHAKSLDPYINYLDGAIVPLADWHKPAPYQLSELTPLARFVSGVDVAVLQVFSVSTISENQQAFRALKTRTVSKSDPFSDPILAAFHHRILNLCNVEPPFHYHGVAEDQPGLPTTSYDEDLRGFVGLHIDSWDAGNIFDRETSRTRLCINLGPEPRYFLFVPVPMSVMLQHVSMGCGASANDIGKSFLMAFPSLPVLKLKLLPGEAYLAPTDNMLHDGCSLGATQPTMHTAFRGHYTIR